jgi:putative nucleotidyltransferase-like protein
MLLSPLHRAVAVDLRRQRALTELLDQLFEHDIRVLVIKGAALAWTLYDAPTDRPRHDADLFVHRGQVDDAEAVLCGLGYRRAAEPDQQVATAQRHYTPPSASGDAIDLHWRVANPRVFDRVLAFDDAWSRSIPVAALGNNARTLGWADTLLLACVHRVAHHVDADPEARPWLQDIDRLVRRLDQAGRQAFIDEASRSGTRAVCARGLELAAREYGTPSEGLIEELAKVNAGAEPSAIFVGGSPRLAGILASDLRYGTWRERAQLMREHLVPSRAYMRSKYPRWPAALIPFAYAVRIAFGMPAWFRNPAKTSPEDLTAGGSQSRS